MSTYLDALAAIPGLTHYYPLDAASRTADVVGHLDGAVENASGNVATGVHVGDSGARFGGTGYIELPAHRDFSVATKKGLTVVVSVAIADWHGAGASEFVHWMGKGEPDAHEWTFRHYVKDGTGEAPQRQGRTSFYHFNPAGGLGAGSFFQDPTMPTAERHLVATCDLVQVSLFVDGKLRDTDQLAGFGIVPRSTGAPVRIGTRDLHTGFLVGTVRRVAFYDRVLRPHEAEALAAAGRAGGSSPSAGVVPSLLATEENVVAQHNALVTALARQGIL